jgi:hypothetical protein
LSDDRSKNTHDRREFLRRMLSSAYVAPTVTTVMLSSLASCQPSPGGGMIPGGMPTNLRTCAPGQVSTPEDPCLRTDPSGQPIDENDPRFKVDPDPL